MYGAARRLEVAPVRTGIIFIPMLNTRAIFSLLLALLSMAGNTQEPEADAVANGNQQVALAPFLQVWVPEREVTLTEVIAADQAGLFKAAGTLAIPVLNRDVWYRFHYTANLSDRRLLVINFQELLYQELELFEKIDGQWLSTTISADQPIAERRVPYRFFALPLFADATTLSTVYFRVNSFTYAFVAPYLQSEQQFFSDSQQQTITSVLLVGAMIALTFYVWLVSRPLLDPTRRFALVGLLLTNLLLIVHADGFTVQFFGQVPHLTSAMFIICTSAIYVFHLLYARYCLNLRNAGAVLNYITTLIIVFILVAMVYALFFSSGHSGEVLTRISIVAIVMIVNCSIIAATRQQPGAGYYLAAVAFMMVIVIYKALVNYGVLEHSLSFRTYFYSGALSLSLLLSISLARRLIISYGSQDALEQKAREAEARDAYKGQFLATMGQEIRTPINGVIGMAQLLSESRLDSTQRDYVDVLLNSSKTLQNMINDILDFSKVSENTLQLEKVDFNLDQLLIYTITTFGQINSGKPIKFDLNEIHPLPFYLKGDPTRIQQIINNLLRQSFSTTERGSVVLSATQVNSDETFSTLKISIRDNSTENPQTVSKAFFDPFPGDEKLPVIGEGSSSLGLAICKRLTEMMGGEIGFINHPGDGNEYWFTLRLEIDQTRQQQLMDSTIKLQDTNIAIVFGNPLFSKSLLNYFVANDISVRELDYDLEDEEIQLSGVDMLLVSNALGEASKRWLHAAQKAGAEILMFNGLDNNIFSNNELKGMGVSVINPPYGISQIIEVIGNLLSGDRIDALSGYNNASRNNDLSSLRILVAEDNLISTKVIEAILKSYQIDADFVTTGSDAVAYYESHQGHYDLILMDYQMPELDGCGATLKIREIEHNRSLPPTIIYAITAYTSGDYRIRCMRAGMNGILTKPLQKALLLELLESVNTKYSP